MKTLASTRFLLAMCCAVHALSACGLGAVSITSSAADGPDTNSYLRYTHPTIREPFVDLLNLTVPKEMESQPLASAMQRSQKSLSTSGRAGIEIPPPPTG